ncbi:Uncharacterised protein [Chryseobacterium nakagawai]|uniref:Uncharacterized protein n=1 Tax=Chryseobacterium nakagawai TaxID=1241982 RepID=A0AAD0YPN5_CHRNA|nr:GDSL-type esterase/lipase family protein [Chryseobacterium nakagawai]AZA93030.1 hypothetical protein EG343_21715 [Chryseobacterium nakagawai]VEH19662.1 Uncharacterised protein [Chryseobacterium nakagawai]
MRFNILKKVSGSGSAPLRKKFAYIAWLNDIVKFPQPDYRGVVLIDDIQMKENTGMMQIYLTSLTQEYSYESVGDSDSKVFKVKFTGTHPGTEIEALEFAKNFLEEPFIVLIPSCDVGVKVLGTPDAPLVFTSSHKSEKETEKFIFNFEQEIGSENVYQLYTGVITLNKNIEVDMGDFLEQLKGYMKLDGSNLTDAQKENLRTILGVENKNIGNSDLSLSENRGLNLKEFVLNFFSNSGMAKVGINKNKPSHELDVNGNIRSNSIIINGLSSVEETGTIKRIGDEIHFKTTIGWEIVMLRGDYVSDNNGIVSPTTEVPVGGWKKGWYEPSTDSIEPGTNYPNCGNLKSIEGYFTKFYFNGSTWESIKKKIPGNSIASESEFRGKIAGKSMSPDQLFKVVGDFDFDTDKNVVDQIRDAKKKYTNFLYNKSNDSISDIVLDSPSGNFTIDSLGLKINSSGPIGSGVILNKQTNLSERFLELKIKLYSDQKIYVGTKNVENVVGENTAEIDCSAKTLKINPIGSVAGATKVFTMPIISGREYIVRFHKINEITRLEIIDTISTESDYIDAVQLGHFDKYKFGLISGTAPLVISNIKIVSGLNGRAKIAFYGDSITEGNIVGGKTPYYKDRFANLIGDYLGYPYYVSGRSAGTIDGVLVRMQVEIPALLPEYVFVTIGTNGNNTEAKLNQLVDFCQRYGCKVILNRITLNDSSTAAKNALIQSVVDARKLMSVKMDIATSQNNDGVTKDNSLFVDENGTLIHPNKAGNIRMFKRVFVDAPEIFQESSIIPKAPEVPVNDINNIKKALKSFVETKYTLDSKFYINDPSHYTIYDVGYWFGRRLKSNNSAEAKTAPQEYYNIWQNISTTQGAKKISKLILNIIPYANVSTDIIKNANLVGVKNGIVTPLVVGTSETVPTALQRFEISVEEYDTFSIGLYNLDSSPVTLTQTIEFYTGDRTIEDDGVRKAIEANSGGTGGTKPGYIDLIDFGCAGDGITDDTAKINAAIVQLINDGGGFLYGRDRKFKVSSITIPDVQKWCRIGIMGSYAPAFRFGTVGTFDVKTKNGMEIISSLNDTSKGIINVSAGSGFGGFNLVSLDIQKLTVRAYNNPQCHGINATNAAQLNIENVIVDTGVYNVQSSLPTAITAGILTPKLSNGAWTTLKNLVVCGYYTGAYIYEHTFGDYVIFASNKIGIRLYKANHSSLFLRPGFYRNQKDIVVEDTHRFRIAEMAVEMVGAGQYDANNEWQKSVYNLEDIGNKGSGTIHYDVCLGGVGPVDTFTKNGGTGITCTKI